EARKYLRYVTSLFDQKVFLLVRRDINAIEELRGRRLAVVGDHGYVTARTLFGLAKIQVTVENAGSAVLDDAVLGRFDGALLLSDEFARNRLGAPLREAYHLLPVPITSDLRRAYRSGVVEARESAGFSQTDVETVTVSALLAVFNWTPSRGRYAEVTRFATALFLNLKGLRDLPDSLWRQADIEAQSPGWVRFPAVLPGQVLAPAQLAELAAVERSAGAPAPASAAGESGRETVRHLKVLAAERAPLADRHLPEGGLITALLNAGLRMAGTHDAASYEIDVNWTSASPMTELLQNESTVDLALPWESVDCEQPNDLAHASAMLCDDVLYSDPFVQLVIGLFALSDGGFEFDTDESVFGKSICVPAERDASVLNSSGRKWLSENRITVIRQPTLLDCISLVQQHEADAFVASDLEGRYVLSQLGLWQFFKMMVRPLGTRGVHVIVPKDRPQAEDLVNTVNLGLKHLKESDAYAAIMRRHLVRLWEAPGGAR
ncbi:MAG: transporter substrate-binding domain-containing protein, partial [Bradyrhizobiaceae bacterium]|nr:transporter substrate-binding domain-containing protein [Bradyrhizobiaceae bacterium]